MQGQTQFNSKTIVTNKTPTILRGSLDMGSIEKDTYVNKTITFSPSFSTTPNVMASFNSASTAGGFGKNTCAIVSVSTTNMVIRCFNGDDNSARAPDVYWCAVEVL